MRTLQEKYNAIQQGKFSKDHFLAEARMQQPQLITRFNGYDDAVQILKNKGMIVEAYSAEESFKDYSNDALTDMIINLSRYEDSEDLIAGVKAELARRKETLQEANRNLLKQAKLSSSEYQTAKKLAGFDSKNYKWDPKEDLYTKLDEDIQEAKLTKKSLTDYRYKPTNDMDKYPYEQILRGIRVELETLGVLGTPTAEEYTKALAKVSKNLEKDSIYYTNQVAGVNPKVDLHDKMVPFTDKAKVDTFNGMKKAALKEGFKKLIKKVLSENMGDMFGDEEREQRKVNYGQPGKDEYDFFSDAENYNDEEEFELQGDEDLDESKMGDVYLMAQEFNSFEQFVQAVEAEHGPVDDIAELEHIFNSTRGEDDIDYGDENFSDPMIDGDDLYEVRKAKSLSQLLK